jgi:hypothetical protein
MNWILHDNYKTQKEAKAYGTKIINLKLSKGAKIKENKKNKKRPFELYIVPFTER